MGLGMLKQDSSPGRLIPLGHGKFAVVDEEDYERVVEHRWYAVQFPRSTVPYVLGEMAGFGIKIFLHRFILRIFDERRIDHRDANPLNNRKENLRLCTHQQSMQNRPKNKTNKSGFKGVYWDKLNNKWAARIGYNSKSIYLGGFKDPSAAARAYDRAARRYHKDFARLNFPKPGEQGA
jgi:hypothetical protein